MKKIISALALASLGLGIATADVTMSLNYRTQFLGYSTDTVSNMNDYFALPTYGGPQDSNQFSLNNDVAGFKIDIAPNPTKTASIDLYEYDAYIDFGAWEFGAGEWKNGKSNGTYQAKNDADASNIGGESFAAAKLGSLYKSQQTTFVDDIVNLKGGSNSNSAYLQWAGKVGIANCNFIGTLIKNAWDTNVASGFGFRGDAMFKNWDTQFVFKTDLAKDMAFAFHAQPYFIPHVQATIGGAFAVVTSTVTEYNFDARVRYQNGPISITFFNNYSHVSTAAAYGKDVGAFTDWAGSTTAPKYAAINNGAASTSAMWNMLAIRYKLSDTLYFCGQVGDLVGLSHFDSEGLECFIAPGIQVFATGKTSITVFGRLGFSNIGVTTDGVDIQRSVQIPVVMRVRF